MGLRHVTQVSAGPSDFGSPEIMSNRIGLILFGVLFFAAGDALGGEPAPVRTVVDTFCVNCHDADAPEGRLRFATVPTDQIGSHPEVWEKVVRRLSTRQMPPPGKKRPSEDVYASTLSQLETALDR